MNPEQALPKSLVQEEGVPDKAPDKPDAKAPEPEETPKTEVEARKALYKLEEDMRKDRMEYLQTLDPQLPEAIVQWKAQFGDLESVHICKRLYIYRGLFRGEYLEVAGKQVDEHKAEHIIAGKGLLWPKISMEDWATMPAGLPTYLAKLISTLSGFEPSDQMPPVRL